MSNEPKILLFDLETSPILAWTWGLFKQFISIGQIEKAPRVMCWSARWHGTKGKTVMFDSEYKSGHRAMLLSLRDLLDEADVVVGYNSDGFDIPWINQQFMSNGIELPSPYIQVDLYKINKKHLRLPSGKLDYLAYDMLGERKVANRGFALWLECMDENHPNHHRAWKEMEKYAKKDTLLLEPLFDLLRPFIRSLNYGLFSNKLFVCTHCGSDHLQARGYRYTGAGMFQRYQCQDCQSWSQDPKRIGTTALRPLVNN